MHSYVVLMVLCLWFSPDGIYYSPGDILQWERLLGSEVFGVREEASRELIRVGDMGLITRLHSSKDVEVRHRARQAYDAVKARDLNTLEPYPFLDSLWYDVRGRYYHCDNPISIQLSPYLGRVVGLNEYPDYGGYRQATRMWVSDLYELGFPVRLLSPIFKEMRKRDALFLGGVTGVVGNGG